jgi:ubiquitin C-terminal hydrolase
MSMSCVHRPCGLRNLGGTCYMNSVLQALSFTMTLTDQFASHHSTARVLVNEFVQLVNLLHSNQYGFVSPAPFKQIIGHLDHVYLGNQQQDAHEFLMFLLDRIDNELNQVRRAIIVIDRVILIARSRQRQYRYHPRQQQHKKKHVRRVRQLFVSIH